MKPLNIQDVSEIMYEVCVGLTAMDLSEIAEVRASNEEMLSKSLVHLERSRQDLVDAVNQAILGQSFLSQECIVERVNEIVQRTKEQSVFEYLVKSWDDQVLLETDDLTKANDHARTSVNTYKAVKVVSSKNPDVILFDIAIR